MRYIILCALTLSLCVGCKKSEGEECAKPDDCGSGLTCVDFVCLSVATIKCKASGDCKEYGLCTAKDGTCVMTAQTDADCNKEYGSDRVNPCKWAGHCTAKDSKCIATSDADCKASLFCKWGGECTLKWGTCIAASDADCKGSKNCKERGKCTAKDGECVK